MSIFNKKEELPGYFGDIYFQRSKSFMGALEYIGIFDEKNILKYKDKIRDFEDVNLRKIINDNSLGKKDRDRLITFGKVLYNLFEYFDLSHDYACIEGNGLEVTVKCETKTGEDVELKAGNDYKFILKTGEYSTIYIKENNYKNIDDNYCFYDEHCNVHLKKIEKKEEGKTDSGNDYLFKDKRTHEYDGMLREHEYNLTNDKYRLLTEITINVTDLSDLTSHIKNLKLPVDIFSYLKDIGEKFVLKGAYIYVMQSYGDETLDSIKVIGGNGNNHLDYCKRTISSNASITVENNVQYDYKVNYEVNGNYLKYRVVKKENNPLSLDIESSGHGMIAQIKSGSEIVEDATKAYQKTLEKLPSWIKRN